MDHFRTAVSYELRAAAAGGDEAQVRELLSQGVDVNGADPKANGCTALHSAIFSGHVSIVKRLLEHGASVHAETLTGQTMLAVALINHDSKVTKHDHSKVITHDASKGPGEEAADRASKQVSALIFSNLSTINNFMERADPNTVSYIHEYLHL